MSSINSFHLSEQLVDQCAIDDLHLMYDTSLARTSRANTVQMQADVVTTSSSTAALTMLGTGTTVISATAAYTTELAAPTYTGQIKYIVQTTTASAIKGVHGSTAGGSATFIDSTKVTASFTAQGQALILKAITATQWAVMANVGSVTTA